MADISIAVANKSAVSAPKPSIVVSSVKAEVSGARKAKASAEKPKARRDNKNVFSVSRDGDTASASRESRTRLKTGEQENLIETQAKANATRASDVMYTQIANQELAENLPNDAQVESLRVTTDGPNPYIDGLKRELMNDIRQAQMQQSAERLENIDIEEPREPVISQAEIEKKEAQIKAAETAEQNSESTFKPQITSFTSYSDQQLRELYLNGDISRYSYDQEMTSRAEKAEKLNENEQVFREGIVRSIEEDDKLDRSAKSLENAFDEDSSDRLTAEQRLAMVEAAE